MRATYLPDTRTRSLLAAALIAIAGQAIADDGLDKITVGMSWYAEAEQGGFYQALAEGLYEKHGLNVTVRDGGPSTNGMQLLMGGAVDFHTGFSLNTFNAVREGIPLVSVAAVMQTDPQTLIVHDGQGYDSLGDLDDAHMMIPTTGRVAYWPWLKSKYGFDDSQLRPYAFTLGPFAQDPKAAQQGYITNDGYYMAQAGVDGKSLLIADYGWSPYGYTIDTTREMVCEHPDIVRRFVAASIEGYKSYLEDPRLGNAEAKKRNPELTDDLIQYSFDKMHEYRIVDSGDAEEYGIGTMNHARWETFFEQMVDAGVLPEDLDYQQGYTLHFVNHPEQDAKADAAKASLCP